ncbi:MAG TPA: chorismate synthase [Fibrobacteria bacterium]|jgi:chorismate synthase|nr:chorismate synthase [Fibrobacteria bacterium]
MSSQFGNLFKIATFGESHGPAVGVVLDGCPSGLAISEAEIQADLDRRRPGQSRLTTPRSEPDSVRILSGLFEGRATGTPIAMMVENTDQRSHDYGDMTTLYRPSHADFTYDLKYGFRDFRGGGRASARETIGRVAAGAVARKLLREACGTEILAYVSQVGDVDVDGSFDPLSATFEAVEASIARCPDAATSARMEAAIDAARKDQDSLGGVMQLVVKAPPAGVGEPVFHRAEAELARAFLSLPATKGFEIGSGFAGTRLRGSAHNDAFVNKAGRIGTETNRSGGVQGGITNGEPILCRVAFKPTATISQAQKTVDKAGAEAILKAKGRHDPCVLPRAVVLVEAMAALVLADLFLEQRARAGLFGK